MDIEPEPEIIGTSETETAFQYQGQLYYRTSKMISKGEELLVDYGLSYMKQLRSNPKKYFEPPEKKSQPIFFTCQYCHIGKSVSEEDNKTCDQIAFNKNNEHSKIKAIFMKNSKENEESKTTKENNKKSLKYLCSICKKFFSERQSLDNHCLLHPDKTVEILSKIHCCQICSFKTTIISNLNTHNCTVGDDRPKYGCYHCKYVAKYKSHLVTHLRLHIGEKPFYCLECNKPFNSKQNLDNYVLRKHDNALLLKSVTSKIRLCSFCNNRTSSKSDYDRHLVNSSGGSRGRAPPPRRIKNTQD
uniref:Gastrula zinc finger protein XlCGF7.1-like isoform X2 n=1 Tax=Diabrotica virgifera virgifera TaxID=50390 RepID=A0A6P7GVE4_DIAVI